MNPIFRYCLAAPIALLYSCAHAWDTADPFDTASQLPSPPRLVIAEKSDFVACEPKAVGSVYSLIDVVDQALCNNPKTHEVWADARVQAAQLGQAKSAYLPQIDGKAGITRYRNSDETLNQRNASLTLSWLIYDFGNRAANLESARELLYAASQTLDATVQSIFLAAMQAYYNTQAANAAVTAAKESEKASQESYIAADTRYKVGAGTPADRLQAQTAWSQATLNRIRAEGVLKNAEGALANVMGLDAYQSHALEPVQEIQPEPSFEQDIESLINKAKELRPDLKASQSQVKAAQANIDAARAAGLPTLSLGAGPSWQNNGHFTSNSGSIGVTLNIPFFSGFDTTYRVRSAKAKADVAQAQQEILSQQISLEVWNAYQNLTTALQSVRTSYDLLASATESEQVALGRYKAGVGNILDVLNAQSALAEARVQKIQSLLDWRVSRASLAKSVGQLDSRLLDFSVNDTGSSLP